MINLSHCVIFRYHSSDPQGDSASSELEEEEVFTIEKLLDKRYPGPKIQYLVKWKDYGDEHNSWEPKSNLHPKVIASFEEEHRIKNQPLQSEPKSNFLPKVIKTYEKNKIFNKRSLQSEPRTNQNELRDDGKQGDVQMMKQLKETIEQRQRIKNQSLQSELKTKQNELGNDGKQGDIKTMGLKNEVNSEKIDYSKPLRFAPHLDFSKYM